MHNEKEENGMPDFIGLRRRYEQLSSGDKAQLGKRVALPDDLALIPTFYKLFPGLKQPSEWHYRVAFLVPFMRCCDKGVSLGEFIGEQERMGKTGNLERRVLQIARATPPQDIVYLRRLLMRFEEPAINWLKSGLAEFFSDDEKKNALGKRKLVEHYFIAVNKKGE